MLHFFATTTIAQPAVVVPGYFDPLELVEHIRTYNEAEGLPWRDIGFAADLAFVESNDRIVSPAVYVLPGDEVGRDSSDMKVIRQPITTTIGVLSVVRHYKISDRGLAAAADLAPIRLRLRNEIIGFKPSGFDRTLRFAKGRLLRYTDEYLVYLDEFIVEFNFQKLV